MKLGCISYINVLPVMWGLESGAVPFQGEQVRAHPSHLNAMMRNGELDITAVSSIAWRNLASELPYQRVHGVALSCFGPVQSVKLFSSVPPEQLQRVGVTPATDTSRTLLRILLPHAEQVPLADTPELSARQPAVLLIGDQALLHAPAAPYELDLGAAWRQRTGLPMVWALWLEKPGSGAAELLMRSWHWGQEHRDEVLAEAGRRTGLSRSRLEDYYACLHFGWGEPERAGLQRFYAEAVPDQPVQVGLGRVEG